MRQENHTSNEVANMINQRDMQLAASPEASASPETDLVNGLRDLRRCVGKRVQLELPKALGAKKIMATLVGVHENCCLIVSAQQGLLGRMDLVDTDQITVRGFAGQSIYSFKASLIRTRGVPFSHLYLSFPSRIRRFVVRQTARVEVYLPAMVQNACSSNVDSLPAIMLNLSGAGALLRFEQEVEPSFVEMKIDLAFRLHGFDVCMNVTASLVKATLEWCEVKGQVVTDCAVRFTEVSAEQRASIMSFVYQRMIDEPSSII